MNSLNSVVSASTSDERQLAINSTRELLAALMPPRINVSGQSEPGFSLDRPIQRNLSDYPKGLPPSFERDQGNTPVLDSAPQIDVVPVDELNEQMLKRLLSSVGIPSANAAPPPPQYLLMQLSHVIAIRQLMSLVRYLKWISLTLKLWRLLRNLIIPL